MLVKYIGKCFCEEGGICFIIFVEFIDLVCICYCGYCSKGVGGLG